ncbi:hypothetical protein [Asticcacaulis solisilvae]|uniref:hypothetical protein n=1 Tax=Asticcacaulis solisilvae TaxID=1217274 RepID=UPI003FD715A9
MRRQVLIGCLGLAAVMALAGVAEARTHHHHKKKTTTVTQVPAAPAAAASASAETAPDAPRTTTYDPAAGFPDRNGPLSGMLIVIPKSEMANFGQPGTRHLDRVARAEPGADLALKLVFTGAETDPAGAADVTYDLQVVRPDGKPYGDSDYRGLEAVHGKVPAGGVFDNRTKVVLMSFDPGDPSGTYTIKATLHDAVGKRDLALTTSIDLIARPAAASADSSSASPAADTPKPAAKTKHRRRHRH